MSNKRKKSRGSGAAAAIVVILIIIVVGLAIYFLTKKPVEKTATALEILPEKCAMFFQMDINKAEKPKFRDELWAKLEESEEFKKKLAEFEKKEGINFKEDVLSWMGGQITISFLNIPPTSKGRAPNPKDTHMAIVISVNDLEKAKAKVNELLEKSKKNKFTKESYENVTLMIPDSKGDIPAIAFINGQLVLALTEDLKKCVDVANKKAEPITKNAEFMKIMAKLPKNSIGVMYMDMKKAMEASPQGVPKDEEAKKMIGAFQGFGFGITMKDENFIGTGFMGLDKNSDSMIIKAIYETKLTLGKPDSIKLFPADTTYYAVTDFRFVYNIIMKMAESKAGGKEQIESGKEQMKANLGVDIDKDIIDNLAGELAYTIDFTDWIAQAMGAGAGGQDPTLARYGSSLKNLATALEMYSTDHKGKYPKNLKALTPDYLKTLPRTPRRMKYYYKKSDKPAHFVIGYSRAGARLSKRMPYYDSDIGIQGMPSSAGRKGPNFGKKPPPIVAALKLKDKAKIQGVVNKLMEKFGMMLGEKEHAGVTIYTLPRNSGGFAIYEDYFLFGLGTGINKINTIIDNKMDKSKSLATSEGYKLIKDKLGNNTLSVCMVKLEKIIPMMKMFVSMAAAKQGPDKAKAAQQAIDVLKKYNEVWTYSSMVEDGVKIDFIVIKSKDKQGSK